MSGMTFEPTLMVDEKTGEEYLSYEHGKATYHGLKEQEIDSYNRQHDSMYYDDGSGELRHKYADVDSEEVAEAAEEINEEAFEDNSDEVMSFVEEQYGDTYAEMIEWAAATQPESYVEYFNNLIDSGSVDEIKEAIENLYDTFMLAQESR